MAKKGSISVFVIVGLLIVIVLGFVLTMSNRNVERTVSLGAQDIKTFSQAVDYVEAYREECIENSVKKAISDFGMMPGQEQELEFTIENEVANCLDNIFLRGFQLTTEIVIADVEISDNSVSVKLSTPLEITSGEDEKIDFDEYIYTFNKASDTSLSVDSSGKTTTSARLVSTDEKYFADIPAGVTLKDANGNILKEVQVKVRDLDELPHPSRYALGNVMYDFTDSKIEGGKVTITHCYDENHIPEGLKESDLIITRYNQDRKLWEEIPSTVNEAENCISGTTDHFSPTVPSAGATGSNFPLSSQWIAFYIEHIHRVCREAERTDSVPSGDYRSPEVDYRYSGLFNENQLDKFEEPEEYRWKLNCFGSETKCPFTGSDLPFFKDQNGLKSLYNNLDQDLSEESKVHEPPKPGIHDGGVYTLPQMHPDSYGLLTRTDASTGESNEYRLSLVPDYSMPFVADQVCTFYDREGKFPTKYDIPQRDDLLFDENGNWKLCKPGETQFGDLYETVLDTALTSRSLDRLLGIDLIRHNREILGVDPDIEMQYKSFVCDQEHWEQISNPRPNEYAEKGIEDWDDDDTEKLTDPNCKHTNEEQEWDGGMGSCLKCRFIAFGENTNINWNSVPQSLREKYENIKLSKYQGVESWCDDPWLHRAWGRNQIDQYWENAKPNIRYWSTPFLSNDPTRGYLGQLPESLEEHCQEDLTEQAKKLYEDDERFEEWADWDVGEGDGIMDFYWENDKLRRTIGTCFLEYSSDLGQEVAEIVKDDSWIDGVLPDDKRIGIHQVASPVSWGYGGSIHADRKRIIPPEPELAYSEYRLGEPLSDYEYDTGKTGDLGYEGVGNNDFPVRKTVYIPEGTVDCLLSSRGDRKSIRQVYGDSFVDNLPDEDIAANLLVNVHCSDEDECHLLWNKEEFGVSDTASLDNHHFCDEGHCTWSVDDNVWHAGVNTIDGWVRNKYQSHDVCAFLKVQLAFPQCGTLYYDFCYNMPDRADVPDEDWYKMLEACSCATPMGQEYKDCTFTTPDTNNDCSAQGWQGCGSCPAGIPCYAMVNGQPDTSGTTYDPSVCIYYSEKNKETNTCTQFCVWDTACNPTDEPPIFPPIDVPPDTKGKSWYCVSDDSGKGTCQFMEDKPSGEGYNTQAECAKTESACRPPPDAKFTCAENYQCVEREDGQYSQIAECSSNCCSPCPPSEEICYNNDGIRDSCGNSCPGTRHPTCEQYENDICIGQTTTIGCGIVCEGKKDCSVPPEMTCKQAMTTMNPLTGKNYLTASGGVANGHITVTNSHPTQSFQVGIASYKPGPPSYDITIIDDQLLHQSDVKMAPPGQTINLDISEVPKPCYQVDAFCGSLITSFKGGVRYDDRKLKHTNPTCV